jgi:hypothetical protein
MMHLCPFKLPAPLQLISDLRLLCDESFMLRPGGRAEHANGKKTGGTFAKIAPGVAGFVAEQSSHDTSDENAASAATQWIPHA